ncbi:hypothetical protein JTB14_030723 [Gonioctena quinquepunctata]|nr:hypothetical protein JTB14_030723 [Gonioctena quinquepunctata]
MLINETKRLETEKSKRKAEINTQRAYKQKQVDTEGPKPIHKSSMENISGEDLAEARPSDEEANKFLKKPVTPRHEDNDSEVNDSDNSAAYQIAHKHLEQLEAENKKEIHQKVEKNMEALNKAHRSISAHANVPLQQVTAAAN